MGVEFDDPIGLRNGGFDGRLVSGLPLIRDVVGLVFEIGPDDWGIRVETLLRAGDRVEWFVVDHDHLDAVLGRVGAGGDHGRDLLALETHRVCGQDCLCVAGKGRHPRQVVAGQHFAGDDGDHAIDRFGSRGVDRVDLGVSQRASDQFHVEHPGQHDVVDVVAPALDQPIILDTLSAVTHTADFGAGDGIVVVGRRHSVASSPPAATISPASWMDFTMFT
jgi:hypothetical protein